MSYALIVTDPAELAILRAQLVLAEEAYFQLITGGQPKVFVDQNGERIEYHGGSAQKLAAYIALLKAKIGTGCLGPLNIWM